jgi:hypothetical protein
LASIYCLFGESNGVAGTTTATLRLLTTGQLRSPGNAGFDSTGTIAAGSWSHIGVTEDGSQGKFYINGALDTTFTNVVSSFPQRSKLALGSTGFATLFFNGSLASWDVYNRVLPASAFANLYNSGNGVAFANYGSIAG